MDALSLSRSIGCAAVAALLLSACSDSHGDPPAAVSLDPEIIELQLDTPLARIVDLAIDRSSGRVALVDDLANQIVVVTANGELVSRIGRYGSGPGEFRGLGSVEFDESGGLYAYDASMRRVEYFDSAGTRIAGWRVDSLSWAGGNQLVLAPGRLFLKVRENDASHSGWRIYTRTGELLGRLQQEGTTSTTSLLDLGNGLQLPVPAAPSFVSAVGPCGEYAYGDGREYSITVRGPSGAVARRGPGDPPRRFTAEEKTRLHRSVSAAASRVGSSRRIAQVDLPEWKAYYRELAVGYDRRLWVRLADLPVETAESDRPFVPVVWDVFEPTGEYRGRFHLPPRTWLRRANGDTVWAVTYSELDESELARFTLPGPFVPSSASDCTGTSAHRP